MKNTSNVTLDNIINPADYIQECVNDYRRSKTIKGKRAIERDNNTFNKIYKVLSRKALTHIVAGIVGASVVLPISMVIHNSNIQAKTSDVSTLSTGVSSSIDREDLLLFEEFVKKMNDEKYSLEIAPNVETNSNDAKESTSSSKKKSSKTKKAGYTTYYDNNVASANLNNVDGKSPDILDMCVGIKDADAIAKSGIKTVTLRVTRKSGNVDESFENNYKALTDAGVTVDVYKFSYAESVEEIKAEAKRILEVLDGRRLADGMVWLDLETDSLRAASASTIQTLCNAFFDVIEDGGYNCGIYCDTDFYLVNDKFAGFRPSCPFWIADWSSNTSEIQEKIGHPVVRHQTVAGEHSNESDTVDGTYDGSADLNVSICNLSVTNNKGVSADPEYATKHNDKYSAVYKIKDTWRGKKMDSVAIHGTSSLSEKDIISYVHSNYYMTCWGYYGINENDNPMLLVEFWDVDHNSHASGFVSAACLEKVRSIK